MNTRSFYIVTIIILTLAMCFTCTVSAYFLNLEAPAEIRVGESFVVSGSTNIPPPDHIDIVFSQSVNIPVEIAREPVKIIEKGETNFNVTFETKGLQKGNYKIEALSQTQRDYSAGSRNLRVIKLIDRSDTIRFSSPSYQDFDNLLLIEARIQDYDDNSIGMEVTWENETVFGPESVPVSRGFVKYELPIKKEGKYAITFTDYKGYVGTYNIQAGEETEADSQPSPIITVSEDDVTPQEPVPPNESRSDNQSGPDSHSSSQGEGLVTVDKTVQITPTQTAIPTTGSEKIINGPSVSTKVSRDNPAYILVQVKDSPVTIKTSDNEDWVFEYKTDPDGAGIKVNDMMKKASEEATITGAEGKIYIKAYPYSYKTGEEITITAANADSLILSDEAANAFDAPPRYSSGKDTNTGKSPAPIAGLILGLTGAAWLSRRRLIR